MTRVGIAGASGYTGFELIKLIHRHPLLEIGWLTGDSTAGQNYRDIYPVVWPYELISLEEGLARAEEVEAVFLCLPHAASMEAVSQFWQKGVRVLDLSADFRLKSVEAYERWYGVKHTAVDLLPQAVYGLAELYRSSIVGQSLIAVPGCYPTSVNLGLFPLAQAGWLSEKVVIDAKSGVSGAGRKAKLSLHYVELNENLAPYSAGRRHRHIAEMEQVLNAANGRTSSHRFIFTPHLVPVSRGILSTMVVETPTDVSAEQVWDLYRERYQDEPFIHLLPLGQPATLAHSVNSNRCAIGIVPAEADHSGSDYIITASIDNLLKGASGQAVQCFNIAMGIDETLGLL